MPFQHCCRNSSLVIWATVSVPCATPSRTFAMPNRSGSGAGRVDIQPASRIRIGFLTWQQHERNGPIWSAECAKPYPGRGRKASDPRVQGSAGWSALRCFLADAAARCESWQLSSRSGHDDASPVRRSAAKVYGSDRLLPGKAGKGIDEANAENNSGLENNAPDSLLPRQDC